MSIDLIPIHFREKVESENALVNTAIASLRAFYIGHLHQSPAGCRQTRQTSQTVRIRRQTMH